MTFSAEGLPKGLTLDPSTGRIGGSLTVPGEYQVTLGASNAKGRAEKKFRIIVGDTICLTPSLGWNSFNTYDVKVNQKQILEAAHAMADAGLSRHGWSVITCDDGWQGMRGGKWNALQPNEGFPDIAGMVAEIHALGLKAGIYSTPWITSYGHRVRLFGQ
jgi:alpha-galactosidase